MSDSILMIEDDVGMIQLVEPYIKELNFEFDYSTSGDLGLEKALSFNYSLVILDLNLPGMNGIDVCRELRAKKEALPIIMLTSKTEEVDKVLGLEFGADDYVGKPFSPKELVARIRALLRRVKATSSKESAVPEVQEFGELKIDSNARKIFVKGDELSLTATEYHILTLLASSPGRCFTKSQLANHVSDYQGDAFSGAITTHLSRLRAKLEPDPRHPTYIETVRGHGYRFIGDAES